MHELVLGAVAVLDGECVEVAPVPGFEHADALLHKLLRREPAERLSATEALLEPFLCHGCGVAHGSAQARLAVVRDHIVAMHATEGWGAVREWHKVRVERVAGGGLPSRDSARWYVSAQSVLDVFEAVSGDGLRKRLAVELVGQEGEVGADYGGLTSNMYREFWSAVLDPECPLKLFEGPGGLKLPAEGSCCRAHKTIGKLMLKCLYDLQPLPAGLAPSLYKELLGIPPNADDWHWFDQREARMMRRMVASPGAATDWEGVTFESVGGDDTALTEGNKRSFFARKLERELRGKRCGGGGWV